ncbi:hypothetical protein [Synechococcus sp. PCC 7336]|uniref:hypothetical protein n=1 Tax=Synechococcus sp. PCC 7336 TaxID=195250 RepID=UPI000374662E|nr:hypothetical protein [Synechococcus sp. PCC 7336]
MYLEIYGIGRHLWNTLPAYGKLLLVIYTVSGSVLVYRYVFGAIMKYRVSKGLLPDRLKEFPVYQTSRQRYTEVKTRCNSFVALALNGHSSILRLSSSDINEMSLVGKSCSKTLPGRHDYYKIENGYIVQRRIEWPEMTRDGCCTTRREITFSKQGENWLENSYILNGQDRLFNNSKEYHLSVRLRDSEFISNILGGTRYTSILKRSDSEIYKEYMTLTKAFKEIKIEGDRLVFVS